MVTMKWSKISFAIVALLTTATLLLGCQPQVVEVEVTRTALVAQESSASQTTYDGLVSYDQAADTLATAKVEEEAIVDADTPQRAQSQDRLIIRTGHLDIVVTSTDTALDAVTRFAEESGGWVVNSNTHNYSRGVTRGDITIRIPAERYSEIMNGVKGLALEVTSESNSGQDVTEEFVDLSSRLGNLEATAERVRSFLDETQNVEEALQVNVELGRLEGDIEVIKGRMKYLSESAAFSTITVSLTPDELNQPIEVAGWRPQGIAKDAIEALLNTLQGLGSILIWITLYLLPVALVLGIPGYYVGRWIIRRWRARRGNTAA